MSFDNRGLRALLNTTCIIETLYNGLWSATCASIGHCDVQSLVGLVSGFPLFLVEKFELEREPPRVR